MKLVLLGGAVAAVAVIVWSGLTWLRRAPGAWHVSDGWLTDHTRRESATGVDLPRWRFPAELKALERKQRMTQIAAARSRMFEGKRA